MKNGSKRTVKRKENNAKLGKPAKGPAEAKLPRFILYLRARTTVTSWRTDTEEERRSERKEQPEASLAVKTTTRANRDRVPGIFFASALSPPFRAPRQSGEKEINGSGCKDRKMYSRQQ